MILNTYLCKNMLFLFHFRISQTNQMFGAFPYYSGSYTHLAEIHIQEL